MTLSVDVPVDLVAVFKAKAGDPTKRATYEWTVAGLAADIKKAAASGEKRMFDRAARRLEAAWIKMTAAQRNAVLGSVGNIIERHYVGMHDEVARRLKEYGRQIATGTRRALRRKIDPGISASLTSEDRAFVAKVGENRAAFVRGQGGKISKAYTETAREIIKDGADKGLSDKQIAKELKTAFSRKAIDHSEQYYRTVANSGLGRSRTWASLNSYREAGIRGYVYKSVLDERTTDNCRFLHNREYLVADGIAAMERSEEEAARDPESIKDTAPFMETVKDKRTGERFLAFKKGDRFQRVAKINKTGVGAKDKIGDYKQLRTDDQLKADGFRFPPAHHL